MSNLKKTIVDYICDLTIKNRSSSHILITADGKIKEWGGDLELYGIYDLNIDDNIEEKITFLYGFFPLTEESLILSCIKSDSGISTDVHIFHINDDILILFLDATEKENQNIIFQQKANDLSLLRDKHSKILDQYLGKELSEKLLELNIQESGELKYVSILFADICGFTSYSENHSPQDVFKSLNTYLAYMIQPVLDNAGIVDKIIGDAVMAIFGVFPSNVPPAIQSVQTAFKIMENVKTLNEERKAQSLDTFDISIGIATGNVFLGILGNKNRRNISTIGHFVNLASRLEGEANSKQILVDENTYKDIEDLQKKFNQTQLTLKGIAKPSLVYSYEEK
ncbi:MAG: hypothetical protein A2086_12770 [Spirochaetes bacterium GWD1_27_9]|nr:MAG: hypothetical protein A2Z98_17965 [Spirochaetes bacterium GWB1_27_13]OHD24027.1 MAG: hypothetical protein A2Y34_13995 [Spirochaetes bacterium GWC1_27_15]OHD43951.1 MAG: hypothetical protein A2086_12770 [Spirochaetes bacterium GWD1_27_9]